MKKIIRSKQYKREDNQRGRQGLNQREEERQTQTDSPKERGQSAVTTPGEIDQKIKHEDDEKTEAVQNKGITKGAEKA